MRFVAKSGRYLGKTWRDYEEEEEEEIVEEAEEDNERIWLFQFISSNIKNLSLHNWILSRNVHDCYMHTNNLFNLLIMYIHN